MFETVLKSAWPYGATALMLFVIGFYYILATTNLVRILIGLEILTKAISLFIIMAGYLTDHIALAQAIVITIIIVEVVVMVVANGIILNVFGREDSIDVKNIMNLKG